MNKLVFDIGATNTKFALMTPEGTVLEREQAPTNYTSIDAYFDTMVQIAQRHSQSADAIAISTNGRMNVDGVTYRAYTSPILRGIDLKAEMEKRCDMPVSVLNDGSAAVVGEWWQGAGRGCRNLLAVVLGSGAGAGLILNDALYEGSRRNASAVFNILCGMDGGHYRLATLPTSFVAMRYQLSAAKGIPLQEMDGKRYMDFVNENDPVAVGLLHKYCGVLAEMIFNAAMLLDLDRIIITGGLAREQAILEGINKELAVIHKDCDEAYAAPMMSRSIYDAADCDVQVVKGELTADANLYGVLYYALHSAEEKDPVSMFAAL